MWAPYNKKKKLKSVAIKINWNLNVLVIEETPTLSQKKSTSLTICSLVFFLYSCLYCHSHFFSLSLLAIIYLIFMFFFFSMTVILTLLSFVLLSQYLSVCSLSSFTILLPLALSFTVSLIGSTPSLFLSLSLLFSSCWHASSAWQSQDCYFIYLVFFPLIYSLRCVSLNMCHCSEWPYRSRAVLGEPVSF